MRPEHSNNGVGAGHGGEAPRQIAFDQLLELHESQADLYEAVGAPAVNTAMAGGVGCVLCYGAQGAGQVVVDELRARRGSANARSMPAPGEVTTADERSSAPPQLRVRQRT